MSIFLGLMALNKDDEIPSKYGVLYLCVFTLSVIASELLFNYTNKLLKENRKFDEYITTAEFNERINNGEQLVVVEDLVLDVK